MTQATGIAGNSVGKGRHLTLKEISTLTHQKGFKWNGLAMAAIALAESGGYTAARNVNSDGSIDRGFLQINNKWHPDVSDACADNPSCAVKAAYKIWQAGGGAKNEAGYKVWSTYGTQAYKDAANTLLKHGGYTGGVPNLENHPGAGGVLGSGFKPTAAISSVADFIKLITSSHFILDALKVIAGAVAIVMGVRQIMQAYNVPTPSVSMPKMPKPAANIPAYATAPVS